MKILIIDNYDSFTYNLYQLVGEILQSKIEPFTIDVFRNDKITLEKIKKAKYERIIISPGPGDPSDPAYFGVCSQVLLEIGKEISVLGVCLGMQGMAYYFGGKVIRAKKPMHGKVSIIKHDNRGIFKGIPQHIEVMRYHSLIAEVSSLPEVLEITAIVSNPEEKSNIKDQISKINQEDIEIMGLRHKKYPIEGVQFHPESFATEAGKILLTNFLLGGKTK